MSVARRFKRITIRIILIGVAAAVIATLFYLMLVLEPQGRSYTTKLQSASGSLRTKCSELIRKTEELLLESPPRTMAEIGSDIGSLQGLSKQTRDELAHFKSVSGDFHQTFYVLIAKDYHRAVTLNRQATSINQQIDEVLDEYDQLINFLDDFYVIQRSVNDELDSFNALTDLNVLSNTSEELRGIATNIRSQTEELKKQPVPLGLEDVHEKSIAAYTHAADGYDALAAALFPPIDSYIYSAAGEIEAATEESAASSELLERTLEELPTIEHVQELTEKIDLLKF